jgi:2-methylisocitrate lyase-like PEP mutase family enzyme
MTQAERAARFQALHERDGAFVLPNPWDAGTARLLASLGFEALATTSAGLAFALGRPDAARAVSREEALDNARLIVAGAGDLPVTADLEDGYEPTPEGVARTITLAAEAGLVGCSVEDATYDARRPIRDLGEAVERVAARSRPRGRCRSPSRSRRGQRTTWTAARTSTTRSGASRPSRP